MKKIRYFLYFRTILISKDHMYVNIYISGHIGDIIIYN
jgi:hypothetical protein